MLERGEKGRREGLGKCVHSARQVIAQQVRIVPGGGG